MKNWNDWIKYVTEKIDNINCSPIQQYMIVLTFEPDDDLKQIIKEHNCIYQVIPKEFVLPGKEGNYFIMRISKIPYNKGMLANDCIQSL